MAAMKKRKAKTKVKSLGFGATDMSLKELRAALREGSRYAAEENWEKALPLLLKVWDVMPDDTSLLTIIAQGLSRLGVREEAIRVLERALSVNEPTLEICTIMQSLAFDMGMFDVALKISLQIVAMNPEDANHYVNLATAYSGTGEYDKSIDMLQQVLPVFPDNSGLWNVLATQVRARDGVDAADVFFEEALRLNPNDFKVLSNYAKSFGMKRDYDKALEMSLRAIEVNPESPEPRVNAAAIYFMKGDMKNGWEQYSCRLTSRRKLSQAQIYTHGLDDWKGESLEGKSVLIAAEQGIGDEVMFGNFLPFIYEQVETMAIGCDHRLVPIYQRRFPNAIVSPYVDQIKAGYRYRTFPFIQKPMQDGELKLDYGIPVASVAQYDWQSKDDIKCHKDGFLTADPNKVAKFKLRVDSLGDKPKVGIAWRSGVMSAERKNMYAGFDELAKIFQLKDQVDFINLQYGDTAEERAEFEGKLGVTVHHFDDVDLKMDIEANLAIMENCDVVVGAFSAPGMFAMSLGRPCMLMGKSSPWYAFGHETKIPFAKDATYTSGMHGKSWDGIMLDVKAWLISRLDLEG